MDILRKLNITKISTLGIKIFCFCFMAIFVYRFLIEERLETFYSYREHTCQNNFAIENAEALKNEKRISQTFIAEGNIISNIFLYFKENETQEIFVKIESNSGKILNSFALNLQEYTAQVWNKVPIDCTELNPGESYIITVASDKSLDSIMLNKGVSPDLFGECFSDRGPINGTLAVGFQFIYKHMSIGNIIELLLNSIFFIVICLLWGFIIYKAESLYGIWKKSEKKKGLWHALFFSLTITLLHNPLYLPRNEVKEFDRTIGAGIITNVDVSRRIGNFNRWFVFFAIVFRACYLLANYLMQRQKGEEGKKAEKFFGDFLVLANCTLLLRCITYFYDESLKTPVYHFSSNFVTLVAFAILAYIILDLEKKITTTDFSKLLLIGASVSYSIMIALGWGQESGRLLLGIMTFCLMIILIVIRGKRAIS